MCVGAQRWAGSNQLHDFRWESGSGLQFVLGSGANLLTCHANAWKGAPGVSALPTGFCYAREGVLLLVRIVSPHPALESEMRGQPSCGSEDAA